MSNLYRSATALIVAVATLLTSSAAGDQARLTIAGATLNVDGRPAFLLGVSLFDALGPTPPRDQDLDALRDWGVRIVRVWAHWNEAIYQADGNVTAQGRSRLFALVERLQARGILLELVLLRPGQMAGQDVAIFASAEARVQAVKSITSVLKERHDVIFDLYNEHDHGGGPISHADARVLRDAVKALDPERLVTISSTEAHLVEADGRVAEQGLKNLREEAGLEAGAVGVDFVSAHLPRTEDWAVATGDRIRALRAALERIGRPLPIYLNEERRAVPPAVIAPDAYRRAFAAAREAAAVGWIFHTAAGYYLAKRPFVEALMPAERSALSQLNAKPH